jgi:hypothetical protein
MRWFWYRFWPFIVGCAIWSMVIRTVAPQLTTWHYSLAFWGLFVGSEFIAVSKRRDRETK